MNMLTALETASALARGEVSAIELTRQCLSKAEVSGGTNGPVFTRLYSKKALDTAQNIDAARKARAPLPPFAGVPISIKDLFDVEGEVTMAGSVISNLPTARTDATAIANLKAAGLIIIGKTNMTEFAYSGLGMNPHYGNPLSPWKPEEERISGGSTSGGAVSVASGIVSAAIGSDTGGSCRIPAAWCGITGFKPSATRVSRRGALLLSPTLDSIGPLGPTVSCCEAMYQMLCNTPPTRTPATSTNLLRLGVLRTMVMDQIDPTVSAAYEQALQKLENAGVILEAIQIPQLNTIAEINSEGGFTAAESWHWHLPYITYSARGYDPRVLSRIERGETHNLASYLKLHEQRHNLICAIEPILRRYSAIIMPTHRSFPLACRKWPMMPPIQRPTCLHYETLPLLTWSTAVRSQSPSRCRLG